MISSLELARLCGVSQGTVDRALHGRGEISAATKERILKAAKKYGYRPNPLVRELLSGKSRTVGALVPSINSIFFLDLLSAIKTELRQGGATDDENAYRLLISPVADAREYLEALEDFAARRCTAVLAVPPEEGLKIAPTLTREMKLISLVSPSKGNNVWFLSPDETQTGADAVEYLYGRGHRSIVHLTYTRRAHGVISREKGYKLAMQQRGLKPVVLAGADEAQMLAALRTHHATALFCHNDWLAISAIRTLEKNGLNVPHEISVLGVDASPTFRALHAGITTLEYPFKSLAKQAAEIIRTGSMQTECARFQLIDGTTVGDRPRE